MTTDATPRPNLDAIAARHSNFPAGEVHALVAYARSLEGVLVRVRGFLDVRVREWLPNEHVSCDIGCSHFAMESECFLALDDEVEALTTILAPERGATEPTHE